MKSEQIPGHTHTVQPLSICLSVSLMQPLSICFSVSLMPASRATNRGTPPHPPSAPSPRMSSSSSSSRVHHTTVRPQRPGAGTTTTIPSPPLTTVPEGSTEVNVQAPLLQTTTSSPSSVGDAGKEESSLIAYPYLTMCGLSILLVAAIAVVVLYALNVL